MSETNNFEIIEGIKCYNPNLARDYADYPSEGFDATDQLEANNFWCKSRNRLLQSILLKYSSNNKTPSRFLELGCGTGFFLRTLAKNTTFHLTGSDVYLTGLKYAKTHLPQTEFIQLDATSPTYTESKFDIIGAFDVIEHIEDDQAVIANAHASLKDNGVFVITVPQYMFMWSALDDMVKHKRRYNKRELVRKLREGGFDITYQSSFVFTLFPLMLISRILDRKKPNDSNFKKEFDGRVKFSPLLNWVFNKLMHIDEFLIRCGFSLPFGGSLLVVAHKSRK